MSLTPELITKVFLEERLPRRRNPLVQRALEYVRRRRATFRNPARAN